MKDNSVFLKGNYMGAPIKIECTNLDHARLISNNMCLDDPLKFDPVHETLLLMEIIADKSNPKWEELGRVMAEGIKDRFETCCPNCPCSNPSTKKQILYKNWEDYWSNGKHGFSSCCRDLAKETWDDFEPTINATRNDWENLLINESIELRKRYIQDIRDMHEYLTEFNLESVAGIKFFRWLLDKNLGR